jgi:hypothetical protein
MWRVIFKELRGLTNSKGLELGPLELNVIYEQLYDVGIVLQSENCMVVFDPKFRPWPHIYQDKNRSKKFYLHLEKHRERDMNKLRAFKGRADEEKYTGMVKRVLGLFGKGIITSLEYTMKDYLRQTDGRLQTGTREPWEREKCKNMLSHNNGAERPFAIARAYKNLYPSLTLANLGKLSQSMANGTHRPRHKGSAAGIAFTADPRLRNCVTLLCNVRRSQVK